MERTTPIRAWIIDDTGIPKMGKHSAAVARQYCGELGKLDNCQVAVTLSVASNHASLPIALRLYLPEDIAFQTKPRIALDQIAQALKDGVPQGIVLADSGYGNDTSYRRLKVPTRVAFLRFPRSLVRDSFSS